ncbi:MAG: hypothetical protein QNL90_19470 [Gammaproteobacteria bacterium]|nr:hypothetical protein [Gammaproteobacteria bacterium]MDX2462328.1 hypothetical protein [Gammaproteobacteria bacterium]
MKSLKSAVALGLVLTAFTANNAWAETCNGYVVSKALTPITMREAPDGSKVKWIGSEGLFIVLNPANHPANMVNRICAGGIKIAADGKSGAAVGSCTYTDMAGDVFHLSWQSGFTEGTWEIVSGTGTGKFAGLSGSGKFWPSKPFDNQWGKSSWEGECSLAQ